MSKKTEKVIGVIIWTFLWGLMAYAMLIKL